VSKNLQDLISIFIYFLPPASIFFHIVSKYHFVSYGFDFKLTHKDTNMNNICLEKNTKILCKKNHAIRSFESTHMRATWIGEK